MQRLVIKIGTNVLNNSNQGIDEKIIAHLVEQIVEIKKNGVDVILVSSGAVGMGKEEYSSHQNIKKHDLDKKSDTVKRQVFASIGQVRLMEIYLKYFLKNQFFAAQVLATREDFRDREHFLNMRNCLEALLSEHIVPIVNENDVVSIDELMFSDNDELAGLLSAMIRADKLIILTNVDGVLNFETKEVVKNGFEWKKYVNDEKSSLGRGGMQTKCEMAEKLAKMGIETVFANGKTKNILSEVMSDKFAGTSFVPSKKISTFKRWLAFSADIKSAKIIINNCAVKVLKNNISILPIGIVGIKGEFKKGENIEVCDEKGKILGVGIARYSSLEALKKLGKANEKALIHRDYLFLY